MQRQIYLGQIFTQERLTNEQMSIMESFHFNFLMNGQFNEWTIIYSLLFVYHDQCQVNCIFFTVTAYYDQCNYAKTLNNIKSPYHDYQD